MKKFALFFLLPVCLFGADLVPQKLILTISNKGPYYKMELFLQKAILSKSKDLKNIYIFSDDNTELKGYGLSQVNVKLFLTLREEKENFVVELYDITKERIKLDIDISFDKKEYLKNIDIISSRILDEIKKRYPPKEKQKLITVETEKKKLSEYEKDKPTFSVAVYFNLDSFALRDVGFYLGQTTDLYGELKPDLSFSPQLNFEFEWMWLLLITRTRVNTAKNFNYMLSISPLFGLFNNLLFVGPFFSLVGGKFESFDFTDKGINLSSPGFGYNVLNIGLELRFNITRNYYIDIGFAFLRPYSELGFNYNGKEIKLPINDSEGPPYLFMNFDIKVLEKLTVSFAFSFYYCGVKREFNNSNYPPPIELTIVNGQTLYLRRISIENSTMGIGIKYEF
ncbi:MAG: hypothetical protein WHS77_09870 [Brevinematales bacterium]